MKGLGSGVIEVALAYRSDAYRTVYAVTLGEDIWGCPCIPEKRPPGGIKTLKKETRSDPLADQPS